jgi:hypothetical protein
MRWERTPRKNIFLKKICRVQKIQYLSHEWLNSFPKGRREPEPAGRNQSSAAEEVGAKVGQPGRVNQKDSGRARVAATVSPEPQFNVPEDIPATEMVWV